ncbi:MAG: T9SS C-terminal target domain-containing protein, partial [Cytophagia bacterium]|nr:T9SS C-terminal target domain-containing protein [Cytophagia bacterium]
VDLSFDFIAAGIGGAPANASNYLLVRSAGIGLGWEIVATASNITGSAVNFNDVSITDGIYTLASRNRQTSLLSNINVSTADGPAGIGSTTAGNIALWLDASRLTLADGAPVTTWPDLTVNARNATQASSINRPIFEANELNGLGVVRFGGVNSFMAGSLGASFNAPFTLFAVARFAQINQGVNDNDYIFDLGVPVPLLNQTGVRASITRRRSNDAIARTNRYYSFQGDAPHYGPVINGGLDNTHAFTATYQLRSPYHQLYYNGALSLSAPGNTAIVSDGTYHLGRLNNTTDVDYFLNGDIAEIIVYNSILSSVQIRIIQSYLAAKWGFTLSNGDLYTGDNLANGDNDLAISGVGRSLEGDVGIGQSAGMTVRMGTNTSAESFVMFGHNVVNNSVNTTDIGGAALFERSNRAWYFTLTGSVGIVDSITFDFSEMGLVGTPGNPANYVLIHRSGTTGNWSIAATASNTVGDRVFFTNVNLTTTGNGYYTLASVNNAPLPVSLLNFEASVINEGKDHAVLLKWQTASEVNNNYFTIERSSDGIKWNSLRDISGKGTYNEVSTYQIIDQEPYIGKSYYRLKQTDNNEDFQFVGGVKAVSIKGESMVISVFPNPSKGIITITSKAGFMDTDEVLITDFTGRILTTEGLQQGHHQQIRLNKKPGLYLLSVKRNSQLIYSQRIMIEE